MALEIPLRRIKLGLLGTLMSLVSLAVAGSSLGGSASSRDDAGARAAFLEAYKVFIHPRCVNCHPAGDAPLQGEDSCPHTSFRLRRGADGQGVFAVRCSNYFGRAEPGAKPVAQTSLQGEIEMNKLIIAGSLALALAIVAGFKHLNSAIASRAAQPQAPGRFMRAREARILGLVDERANDTVIAPSTVSVGEDFQVTVTTTGSGCERAGDTGVVVTENGATVMVYDFTSSIRPGVTCTLEFKRMPHTVTLRFTKPGEALIQVWGRRVGPDTPPVGVGVPTVLERRVMVN